MKIKLLLLYSFLFIISSSIVGQINLKSPQICHDTEGYLKCYFDNSYLLRFNKGNLINLSSADSCLKYSDINKTLSFYSLNPTNEQLDTIQIKLQLHSILLINGSLQKEITSLPPIPSTFDDFQISTYTVNNVGRGLTFWAGNDKYVKIEVWNWKESWTWKIVVREPTQTLLVDFNEFRKNRIETIMLQNDSLKYGMSISMTFKSLKKLWWLRAVYVDSIKANGRTIITSIPIENPYWYWYKKNGKIDKKKTIGELKLCNCD